MTRNGWFRDSYRHSLAARGIKTSFADRYTTWGRHHASPVGDIISKGKERMEEEKLIADEEKLKAVQEQEAFDDNELSDEVKLINTPFWERLGEPEPSIASAVGTEEELEDLIYLEKKLSKKVKGEEEKLGEAPEDREL